MSGSRTEQVGTGHVDGQVWERPGHWSLCCAEGGVSGVLALTRDLGIGHLEGRGGMAGWASEATWETTPTAGGGVPGMRHLALQFLDLSRVGVCTSTCPLSRGVVCHGAGAVSRAATGSWLQKSWFGKGHLLWIKWRALAVLGSTWPWLPWGLFALREERQQGFCQLWAGAGSRELLSWLRSVVWRDPLGLPRSG